MKKPSVLAICIHNSARSQLTEEYMRMICGDRIDVTSAGIEPGSINPIVAELLLEDGIDIRAKETRSVYDLHAAGAHFDYVIAVCDPEAAERCPIFPAERKRLHWPFPDPSRATGSRDEKLAYVRPIARQIRERVTAFCADLEAGRI